MCDQKVEFKVVDSKSLPIITLDILLQAIKFYNLTSDGREMVAKWLYEKMQKENCMAKKKEAPNG